MTISKKPYLTHEQARFSRKPTSLDWRFWAAREGDGGKTPTGSGGGDEKLTLEEAKQKLKDDGFVVMKQTAFDETIKQKYTKAYNDAEAKLKESSGPVSEELQKENQKLKEELENLKKSKPETVSKSEHEQLLKAVESKYTKELEGTKSEIARLRQHHLDNEILKVISDKTVDSEAVLSLTRSNFKLGEDGKIFPVNQDGEKIIDDEGLVDTTRFYSKFFDKKPYLAKSTGTSGAGSQGSSTQGAKANTSGKHTIEQLAGMSEDEFIKCGGR